MARIAGVDLPNKHVNIALTYIYGIGRSSANTIDVCQCNVDMLVRDVNSRNSSHLLLLSPVSAYA